MYNELRSILDDKTILENQLLLLQKRTETEEDDKVLKSLLCRIEKVKEEIEMIESFLNWLDSFMKELDDIEKRIFRYRYLEGLSIRETSLRLRCGITYVKEKTRKMFENQRKWPFCGQIK